MGRLSNNNGKVNDSLFQVRRSFYFVIFFGACEDEVEFNDWQIRTDKKTKRLPSTLSIFHLFMLPFKSEHSSGLKTI